MLRGVEARTKRDLGKGDPPTEVYGIRGSVRKSNMGRLKKLKTPTHVYECEDVGERALLKNVSALERLEIKSGARVMLLRNVDSERGLVNGVCGRVVGFYPVQGGRSKGVVRDVELDSEGAQVLSIEEGAGRLSTEVYPYVKFDAAYGSVKVLVLRDEFKVEVENGIAARRVQLPLDLAWAMTAHKVQGLTMGSVRVYFDDIFAPGRVCHLIYHSVC